MSRPSSARSPRTQISSSSRPGSTLTAALRTPGAGPTGAVQFSLRGRRATLLAGDLNGVLEPVSAGPATALLAAVAIAAFLTDRIWALAAMTVVLLVICLRAPVQRRWPYIFGALVRGAQRDPDLAVHLVVRRRDPVLGRARRCP